MRHLILHRERALVGFALKYYCVLNQDRDAFLTELPQHNQDARTGIDSDHPLRNGETISLEISDDCNQFFVAVYLDGRSIVTESIIVEAGTSDAVFVILTRTEPYKGMEIAVVPTVIPTQG